MADNNNEEQVVNLCEDLKPHVHDDKGYEKIKDAQDAGTRTPEK